MEKEAWEKGKRESDTQRYERKRKRSLKEN